MDTIFALSSGQPPAAIGIIRISGPRAGEALRAICGRMPNPRLASVSLFSDPQSGEALDRGLALWFPGPATATGEDLAELHCHGGRAVTAALLAALARIAGLRGAMPGEFTRRAFENGRIDLSEAEGLSDLLFAETESQRRAAMMMAEGHFSRKVTDWQGRLLALSASVEAALDFSDEDDVPDAGIEARIRSGIAGLADTLQRELARPDAERLRDGVRVVLAGPPNAGKSTLLNALVGRDAAIVSDIAGTTRDRIEAPAAIGGIPFLFTDTAGLRADKQDAIEAIGMARAEQAIAAADILLWMGDPADAPRDDAVKISAKKDVAGWQAAAGADLDLSAISGDGMAELVALLLQRAQGLVPGEGDYALHARQRREVEAALAALSDALETDDLLIVAEHLRLARGAMDALTGRAGTEDMLDALFGKFCIGK
ncbi:tRNA uridine-5-carboxymethylaminomethyl(34) synthesis GTPase MnmE [Sphingobium phenoxybenzoativorans]|uniref:tRNA uridine-5-carboxymethylaminomethyl(34) synthesis GTPase MnmE n=1 Tax=Sphingobium phenoxybenzoativorans TaxID=1592790 RepID=UPI000872080E|nr:tRNA uridine-5-carboxymethylaminomethyl(34) synthesis GTPase MnmE [Sphingobium phenoxybenzoativorans]